MKTLICIQCPRGCTLTVSDSPNPVVTGNACPKGEVYGRQEAIAPMRIVTATCAVRAAAPNDALGVAPFTSRRIPVKTQQPVPLAVVTELSREISRMSMALPVKAGEVLIEDWQGRGIRVVVTRTMAVPNAGERPL